jgi:hypothetical protein
MSVSRRFLSKALPAKKQLIIVQKAFKLYFLQIPAAVANRAAKQKLEKNVNVCFR